MCCHLNSVELVGAQEWRAYPVMIGTIDGTGTTDAQTAPVAPNFIPARRHVVASTTTKYVLHHYPFDGTRLRPLWSDGDCLDVMTLIDRFFADPEMELRLGIRTPTMDYDFHMVILAGNDASTSRGYLAWMNHLLSPQGAESRFQALTPTEVAYPVWPPINIVHAVQATGASGAALEFGPLLAVRRSANEPSRGWGTRVVAIDSTTAAPIVTLGSGARAAVARRLRISNDLENNIRIGMSNVTTSTGTRVQPGQVWEAEISRPDLVYVIAEDGGDQSIQVEWEA